MDGRVQAANPTGSISAFTTSTTNIATAGSTAATFLKQAAVVAGGLAMAQALMPRYANAQTISFTDERIKAQYVTYPSPGGSSGTMRGYLVQPKGTGPFPVGAGDPRESRPQSLHRGRRPPRRDRGLPGAGAGRAVPGRRLSRQRRRRPRAAGQARPDQAAHRHAEQRQVPEGACALVRQARRHRLLLGRRHDQLSRRHARRRPARPPCRIMALRRRRPRCRTSRRRC